MDELILSWWSWLWNSHNLDEYEKLGIDEILKNLTHTSTSSTATTTTATTTTTTNNNTTNSSKNFEIISKVLLKTQNKNLNENDSFTTTENFLEATSKILTKLLKNTISSYSSSSLTATKKQQPISSLSIGTKSKGISDQFSSDYSTISGPDLSASLSSQTPSTSAISDGYVSTQLLPPLLPSSSTLSPKLSSSSSSTSSSLLANFSTISTSTSKTSITSNYILDSLVSNDNSKIITNKSIYQYSSDHNYNHNYNSKLNQNSSQESYIINNDQLIKNIQNKNDTISFRELFKNNNESINKFLSSNYSNKNNKNYDDVNYNIDVNSNGQNDYGIDNYNNVIKEFIKSSKDVITEILSSSSSSTSLSSSTSSSESSTSLLSYYHQEQQKNQFSSQYYSFNNMNGSSSKLLSAMLEYNSSKILDTSSLMSSTPTSISLPSSSSSKSTSLLSVAVSELNQYKYENLSSIWKTSIMKGSLNYDDDNNDYDDRNVGNFIGNLLNNDNKNTSNKTINSTISSIGIDINNSNNNNNISLSSINQTTINTINLEDMYNDSENFLLDIILNCNNVNNNGSTSTNYNSSDYKFLNSTTVTNINSTIGNNFNLYKYCCNLNNRSDIINGISNGDSGIFSNDIINDRISEIIGGMITINVGGYNQTVNCTSLLSTLSMSSIPSSSSSPLITSSVLPSSDTNYLFGTEYEIETVIQLITTFGIAITLGIIILATVIGNVFVIAAILLERNLQSVSNYLILSLAVADLLVACLVMPLSAVYEVSQEWKLGPELCDMWTSSDVLCCTASILHLVAIALDRYWAVTNIDYIHQRTARRIGVMILIIWGLSFLVSVAPLLGWKDPKWDERVSKELKCMVSQDIGYQIFATASSFYVPLLVILILYWRIFQTARKRIRRRQQAAQTHPEPLMANASCLPLTGIGFRWKVTATPPASGGLIATAAGGSGGIAAAVVTVIGRPLPTISETTTAFTNISSTHTSPEKGSYGNGMDRIENDPPTADISTCGGGAVAATLTIGHHTTTGVVTTTQSIRPKIVRKKTQTSVDSKRERKAAKTLAIITGAFVCCWLPFFTLAILLPICQCYIPPVVMSLSLWLGYFNSTLNPIIYTIFSPEFRHAFKRLLCGRRNSIRRQTRCVRR